MIALPPLREVIARHGLRAQKSLGQNFLLDINLTRRIARAAGPLENTTVIEIGPGPGGLTRAILLEGAKKVIAIERDERAIPALRELAEAFPGRLDIRCADALGLDYAELCSAETKIIANLPYNIATPLLLGWLLPPDWPPPYSSLILMFQKEVAERICAAPNSKSYGRLSVISQWRSTVAMLFDVDAQAFTPRPKVTSSIVEITPFASPRIACRAKVLERVTQAAFGQRRKMLRQSLKSIHANPVELLTSLDLDPQLRAEALPVDDFCRIAQALE